MHKHAVIGYFTENTTLQITSSNQGSTTVQVSCQLSAVLPVPGSVGCKVCEGEGESNCYTFTNASNQMTIRGQATFTFVNEDDHDDQIVHTYYVYAVDGSSARLDNCVYAQTTNNESNISGK